MLQVNKKRTKRASNPCGACRQRKSRCITRKNSRICTMCEMRESECVFPSQSKTNNVSDGGNANSALDTLQETSVSWPNQQNEVQFNDLSSSKRSVGMNDSQFGELYGLTSDMEPILMRHRPYNPQDHEYHLETHSIRRVQKTDHGMEYPIVFHMIRDSKAVGFSADHAEVDAIESLIRPCGPRLVRLFWLVMQPSYPLLDKKRFMELYTHSYRKISAGLLGAVYLNAIQWWTYDSELSLRPPPNIARLRKLTLDTILNEFHRPHLPSIEAMLLYLQRTDYEPLASDHTFLRGLTSQMLAVAEAIGLHIDPSGWTIPEWERAQRRRISWALYMQEKWTALSYGRPSHISEANWTVTNLTLDDFKSCNGEADTPLESSIGFEDTSGHLFILMVDLTKILSRVLSTFFCVQASRSQDTVLILEKAQSFIQELEAWRETAILRLPMTPSRPRQFCPSGHVYLCYFGVLINIMRRLVRSTALAPLCSDTSVLATIRQLAYKTAHDATNFVSSLRLDQIQSFWFFPSPYLFSLVGSYHTLLLVTSLSETERDYWRQTLVSFLWDLRMKSKASEPMRYAVNRLEGGVLRGLEHALAMDIDAHLSPTAEPIEINEVMRLFELGDFAQTNEHDLGLESFDWLSSK